MSCGITRELAGVAPAVAASSGTVYLDCYEVLGDTPQPVLTAALAAGRDVVVNLAVRPPPPGSNRP